MSIKIGLPKALLYYRYYSAWKTFFTELDCKIIESEITSEKTVEAGVKLANDEACFPVKLFLGHVKQLQNKVDYIFAPRMISVNSGEYLCPKFMGLPEMIKHNFSNPPRLIESTVDLRKNKASLVKTLFEIGKILEREPWQVVKAGWKAWINYNNHRRKLREKENKYDYKIGVLGHEYIIYDPQMSMGLVDFLEDKEVGIITPDMLPSKEIKKALRETTQEVFWTFNKQMLGAAYHFFKRPDIDGIIQLTAFGCGPDSLVGEVIEREAEKRKNQLFLGLNLDEHTGRAGFITRLEAFLDMLQWKGA